MAANEVEIHGLSSTVRQLRALAEDAPKRVREINLTAAKLVAEKAQELAPVGSDDRDVRPGALKVSIRARATTYAAYVSAGNARVLYAGVQNTGWGAHNIVGTKFLWRARDSKVSEVVAMYDLAIGNLCAQVRGGGE